ncbi:MAG TPA: transglycosylase family protein [Acidimicrobiales bacterium]|nr:transglycosylase family protein [Acidimicrobiales bacterium]
MTSFGAPAIAAPQSAVDHDRGRIAALYREQLAEARSVHSLTLRFAADVARARQLQGQARTMSVQLTVLKKSYGQTAALAREDAILSYVGEFPAAPPSDPGSDFATTAAAKEYESATLDDMTTTMARLARQQTELSKLLSTYRSELSRITSGEAAAAASRRLALLQAQHLQAMIGAAQHQLAQAQMQAKAAAGPPVGNGLVKAVNAQLNDAAQSNLGGFTQGPGGLTAVTAPAGVSTTEPARAVGVVQVPTTGASGASTTTTQSPTTQSPSTVATTTAATTTTATTTTTAATTTAATTTAATTAPVTTTSLAPSTTTAPSTTSTTATSTATTAGGHPPPLGGAWLELRQCESGDNYAANTGNGFYGAYQFSGQTWSDLGYPGRPDQEPYWMQDQAAERLHAAQGWSPWPSCSAALGL